MPGSTHTGAIHPEHAATPRDARSEMWLLAVLLLTIAVRIFLLIHIALQHPTYIVQNPDAIARRLHVSSEPYMNNFGFEASNIAFAWVCDGQGYASPFGGATGPTAWIAPGIVMPYAVSFALWGCFTPASILFAYGIALIVSVVTAYVVYRIGWMITGRRRTGLLAAALFAVLPYEAWIFHTRGQLDFNYIVMCFALLLLALLKTIEDPGRSGLLLGVTSSLAALFNPGFLFGTAIGFLLALPERTNPQRLRLALTLLVTHVLLLGPYVAWQSIRIGTFVPVKSNAPVELFIGNTDTAAGLLRQQVFLRHHPSQNNRQYLRYKEIGEGAYVNAVRRRFLDSFDARDFMDNTVRRCYRFFAAYTVKPWDHSPLKILVKRILWLMFVLAPIGLVAIRKGRPSRLETAALAFSVAYAVPYLLTGIMERYRIPMTPMVVVALAILISEAWRGLRGAGTEPPVVC